jgi:hypothetical protein
MAAVRPHKTLVGRTAEVTNDDSLIGAYPLVRDNVAAAGICTIPANYQLLVSDSFTINLTGIVDAVGELVIL